MPPTPRKAAPKKATAASNPFSDVDNEPDFDADEPLPDPPKYRPSPLKGKLEQFYGGIGLMVSIRDRYCGSAIITSAESTAIAMDRLARENATAKRILETLVASSIYMEVIAAHMPIIMAIAMHHGPETLVQQLSGMQQAQTEAA